MVALFHVGQLTYSTGAATKSLIPKIEDAFSWPAQLARILGNGPGAVIFFFVLSGFVLTMVLERSSGAHSTVAVRFAIGRVFRIFPGVWCTLGIFVFFFLMFGKSLPSVNEFALNALLIDKNIDGVMWSLQLELAAVPLLLAVYFGWRQYGFAAIFGPYILLLGLSFVGWWNHLCGDPGQFGQIYAFLAGMTAYIYGPKYVVRLRRPWLWAACTCIAFLVVRHVVGWSSYFTYWFEATFASSLVALFAFGINAPTSALWYRSLQFVGRVSFSFYILHPLTLIFQDEFAPSLSGAVQAGVPPLMLAAAALLASTAVILPLAWLQYRLVEVPMIAFGKIIVSRRKMVGLPDKKSLASSRAAP